MVAPALMLFVLATFTAPSFSVNFSTLVPLPYPAVRMALSVLMTLKFGIGLKIPKPMSSV